MKKQPEPDSCDRPKPPSQQPGMAPEEVERISRVLSLQNHFGSGIWEGDLSCMREDRDAENRS